MKKILYITTLSSTINRFLVPHIQKLIDDGYKVDCAANINRELDTTLLDQGVKFFNIPFTRNPLDLKNLKAFKELIKIQNQNSYDIIHVHTPIAALYGRLLKVKFNNIKTIYTAHGFHFYKGAPKKNWLIYYPIEKFMSKFTDTIITMNNEDYELALKFNINNTYKVNGVGVDLNKYNLDKADRREVREELRIKEDTFVVLMIAEVNKNKNHKQVIEAMDILKNRGINDIKILCAGRGPLLNQIAQEVKDRKLNENIVMLGYRNDIYKLISACDIGILTSYREGLPRNIMELMACKKPVIGTNIRGIKDLIHHGENGYLVKIGDSIDTANKIEILYRNKKLLKLMSERAYESIQIYDVYNVIKELEKVYI